MNPRMINPTILLIIVILAFIFFLAGILQLLIRCLLLTPNQSYRNDDADDDTQSVTVLHGQLHQLFQLHDGGVDQSQIDTLPIFHYKSITGRFKDPFDCAVCLSEFEPEDKLRLLPKCSHAFHMDCIDTWLLANSTCPLCRASLLDGFGPVDLGRVSGSDSDQEHDQTGEKTEVKTGEEGEKIVSVKLGKFRSSELGSSDEFGEDNELGSRRCFSMGSFAYILDEKTSLQVPIRATPMKKQSSMKKKQSLHRTVMSEYGCENYSSMRTIHERERDENFSFSKIWGKKLRNGGECSNSSSRRTISMSEIVGDNVEEEIQSCYSFDSMANNHPSCESCSSTSGSTRRTLLWLMGRHPKVSHNHSSSFSSNV